MSYDDSLLETSTLVQVTQVVLDSIGVKLEPSEASMFVAYIGNSADNSEFNLNGWNHYIYSFNNYFETYVEVNVPNDAASASIIVNDSTNSVESINSVFTSHLWSDGIQTVVYHPYGSYAVPEYLSQWVNPVSEATFLDKPAKRLSDYDASLRELDCVVGDGTAKPSGGGEGYIYYELPVKYGSTVRLITLPPESENKISNVENTPVGIGINNNGYSLGGKISFTLDTTIKVIFTNGAIVELRLKPFFFERVDI